MRRAIEPAINLGLYALLLTLAASGCKPGPHTISVTPSDVTVSQAGATVQLEAEPRDRRGAKVDGVVISYRAREPSVATVSSTGLVSAISHGATTLEVRIEGTDIMEFVRVVVRLPEKLVVRPSSALVYIGGMKTLEAQVLDHDGKAFENTQIEWTTGNESVAMIERGQVTGVDEGETEITATSLGLKGISKVRVSWGPGQKAMIEAEKRFQQRSGRKGGGGASGNGGGPMDPRLGMFRD